MTQTKCNIFIREREREKKKKKKKATKKKKKKKRERSFTDQGTPSKGKKTNQREHTNV